MAWDGCFLSVAKIFVSRRVWFIPEEFTPPTVVGDTLGVCPLIILSFSGIHTTN